MPLKFSVAVFIICSSVMASHGINDKPKGKSWESLASLDAVLNDLSNKKVYQESPTKTEIIADLKTQIANLQSLASDKPSFEGALKTAHSDLVALGLTENPVDSIVFLSAFKLIPQNRVPAVKAALLTSKFKKIETFPSYTKKTRPQQIEMKAELLDLLVRVNSGMERRREAGFEGFEPKNEFDSHAHLTNVFDATFAAELRAFSIPDFQVTDRYAYLRSKMEDVFNPR